MHVYNILYLYIIITFSVKLGNSVHYLKKFCSRNIFSVNTGNRSIYDFDSLYLYLSTVRLTAVVRHRNPNKYITTNIGQLVLHYTHFLVIIF